MRSGKIAASDESTFQFNQQWQGNACLWKETLEKLRINSLVNYVRIFKEVRRTLVN